MNGLQGLSLIFKWLRDKLVLKHIQRKSFMTYMKARLCGLSSFKILAKKFVSLEQELTNGKTSFALMITVRKILKIVQKNKMIIVLKEHP